MYVERASKCLPTVTEICPYGHLPVAVFLFLAKEVSMQKIQTNLAIRKTRYTIWLCKSYESLPHSQPRIGNDS